MEGKAWTPCHITGFFYPCGNGTLLDRSSLGAGVNIIKGVTTKVYIHNSKNPINEIYINRTLTDASVSKGLLEKFLEITGKEKYSIIIEHKINMPMMSGFGTSGSGVLSLSLALKRAFNIKMDDIECYRMAHITEVEMKTGLGTVMGEIQGGLEIRVGCGGPGIGKVENIPYDKKLKVIILHFGEYSTQKALSDKTLIDNIIKYGKSSMNHLLKYPTVESFIEISRWFVEKTEVADKKVINIINLMDSKGFLCSMPLFGKSLFCIIHTDEIEKVNNYLKEYGETIITDISAEGPE